MSSEALMTRATWESAGLESASNGARGHARPASQSPRASHGMPAGTASCMRLLAMRVRHVLIERGAYV